MATTATMSGLQFDALSYEEGRCWELLEGDLIEVSSPTPRHQAIVFRILRSLLLFLENATVHCVAFAAVEFALSDSSRLRPDVCVLLSDSAARLNLDQVPIPGAPDLAIEVISPTERASESYGKVRAYLRNGTAEVWQIFPKSRSLQIHTAAGGRSLDSTQEITTGLLPGYCVAVLSFFE